MRVMPVTNQNNFKTQTSFKRFIQTGQGIINENDIVSVGEDSLSYLEYKHEMVSGGYDSSQARLYLVTAYYSPYGKNFLERFKSALENLNLSPGEIIHSDRSPVYNYDRTYIFPTPHKKEI